MVHCVGLLLRTMIEGLSGMVDRVSDCALKYPYAFFAYEGELKGQKLVEILDIEMNQLMRKIEITGHSMYNRGHSICITLNGNILATKIQGFQRVCDVAEARIFIHDIEELVNPSLSTSDLWMKTLEYSGVIESYHQYENFHIASNSSSLFAISESDINPYRRDILIWNFLNNKNCLESSCGSVKCPEKK